ncbi:MAG TPA: ABC transporter ATP-binding protein [Nitrospirales bacterium]|nr:ABC transporter ATP-binding protein [Nitrospirales bacterium]HIA13886.1 ABC transporter ATP-binding protein [Nitrospirales bacterium]HIB54063.1 ABC transporter ATP-binding protein [Nitrospirales bacterium]HIC04921.1 ABC transporter ATP-binding protein [Nitrospirales bacterium]HIN32712.1 ABC transporter ATP-binding protein [Nitrospirales bacterium]
MIQLDGVTKVFSRGERALPVLRGITLQVPKGVFLSIMGPSGSGKSTLINLIAGLDVPTEGQIIIDGKPTETLSDDAWTTLRGTKIGIVFQFFNLLPTLSVIENVALPLQLQGINGPEVTQRAKAWLQEVELHHRGAHYPHELSGGEQQRAAVARAMVHEPDILLADEPTGNLDTTRGREIVDLMRALTKKSGQTVVMVTHSHEAAAMADRTVTMIDGRLSS